MKKVVLLTGLVMFILVSSNATVWRVNNTPGVNASFSTFSAAHNAAYVYSGDTIYLEPGAGTYGDVTITKKLIIIGNGYFCSENIETQSNISTSRFDKITLNNGSQGTIIEGCQFEEMSINTSNIVIQRNFMSNSGGGLYFNTNDIANIIIRDNYLFTGGTTSYSSYYSIKSTVIGVNNVVISNNFIKVLATGSDDYSLYLNSGFSGVIENNVIIGNTYVNNSSCRNNIQVSGTFTQTNCTYTNNLGSSTQFGTSNGNQQNVIMANVFLGAGSTDGQWQLKPGSPAIGAGVGGVDCGMFGGDFPYVLSGIPAIPAIYQLDLNVDNVNQQIEVEMSTKSHN